MRPVCMQFLSLASWVLAPQSSGASEPLRIVAVERLGLPPFEDDRRIYRLQGQARVSPGELLELTRPGMKDHPGRLRVLRTTTDGVLALLERRGDAFPMKGDLALHWAMTTLPTLPTPAGVEAAPLPLDTATGIPRDPRTLHEGIYFLPSNATLSPLGRTKIEAWVREYGQGRWTLEIPKGSGGSERLTARRVQALKTALEGAGVRGVRVKSVPPQPGQRSEGLFLRFQEGQGLKDAASI